MGSSNYIRRLSGVFKPRHMRFLANLWPPFLAAGIRIDDIANDYSFIRVSMGLKWYNRNYVGTHFGGSLYAMTDPFYMLMLIQLLGRDFIVWDKAAAIDFVKPGMGRVTAEFRLSEELVSSVRQRALKEPKLLFDLPVEIKNEKNEVVAKVQKTLYVRFKGHSK